MTPPAEVKPKSKTAVPLLIGVAVAAGLAAMYASALLFFRPFVVPTGAMENTLLIGDRIIGQIRNIGELHRGEIVLHRFPADPRQILVKRIVAVPGDHLKIARKQLYINGTPPPEPYVKSWFRLANTS